MPEHPNIENTLFTNLIQSEKGPLDTLPSRRAEKLDRTNEMKQNEYNLRFCCFDN